jgi:23S rRNA (cytosine1962-C5)-methyltransferase
MDLNQDDERISRCPHRTIQADVFNWLGGETSERYDLIVLDPPSLARREAERAGAIRAYRQLAQDAVARLRPGGILVACSCSAHVTREEFHAAVQAGAAARRRDLRVLRTADHPADHAPSFAEAHYLKCICLGHAGDANPASR